MQNYNCWLGQAITRIGHFARKILIKIGDFVKNKPKMVVFHQILVNFVTVIK